MVENLRINSNFTKDNQDVWVKTDVIKQNSKHVCVCVYVYIKYIYLLSHTHTTAYKI